ncbi:hypothetical protein [Luteolibacter luteus]|uniref:DUF4034 domain-containing protein n=1 Tax=Luteolibacter luteus TaxID=2728835 RepID=A0A858RPN3_9BACT|nr:hypothetical protein [Luteolibacter luteus]QJE98695.1 hypothetical protein HHL09_23900 [Luteolibacter luteus]
MSTPSPLLFCGACAAIFVAASLAGWNLTSTRSSKAPRTPTAGTIASAQDNKRAERGPRGNGVPDYVRETMVVLRASSPEQRMRATIDLATTMPMADLSEWLDKRWFDMSEGFDVALFQKIAMQRWEAEDREGFIAWNIKNNPDRAEALIASWAKEHPALALSFFMTHTNPRLEVMTLGDLAASEPELALEHLVKMLKRPDTGETEGYFDSGIFRKIAEKDPALLEASLDSLPFSWRLQAESIVVGRRMKESFTDELRKLAARPDGWKLFENAMNLTGDLKTRLVEELQNLPDSWKKNISNQAYLFINQANARQWLDLDLDTMDIPDAQKRHLRSTAMQNHASKNPIETLGLVDQFELDKEARQNLISGIIANNPKMIREDSEKLISALGSEEDREIARSLIAKRQEIGDSPPKVAAPNDWLEQVSATQSRNGSDYLFMLRDWDKEKIAALSDGFQRMPDEKKLAVANVIAAAHDYGIDSGLRGEAIRYLVAQPPAPKEESGESNPDPSRYGPEINPTQEASRYAVALCGKDPDAAARWVQSLPRGDAKQWATKNLAANWRNYDPQATQEWLNSLPSGERKEVEAYLKEQPK